MDLNQMSGIVGEHERMVAVTTPEEKEAARERAGRPLRLATALVKGALAERYADGIVSKADFKEEFPLRPDTVPVGGVDQTFGGTLRLEGVLSHQSNEYYAPVDASELDGTRCTFVLTDSTGRTSEHYQGFIREPQIGDRSGDVVDNGLLASTNGAPLGDQKAAILEGLLQEAAELQGIQL